MQINFKNLQPHFYPKTGSFLQLIKNYAQTTKIIDENFISKASHAVWLKTNFKHFWQVMEILLFIKRCWAV